MSRVVTIDPAALDETVLEETAAVLSAGEAAVIPTETQYGLALRADRDDSADRICAIKKRRQALKAALFVKDISMAERFCSVTDTARRLADRFLPGPLTLVLPALAGQAYVSPEFASDDGFGIRISSSPVVAAIMQRIDFPVTATSANLSGETTPATVAEIREKLGAAVALYVDGGPCRGVIPSTVIRISDEVGVLRPGLIPESEIRAFLQKGT